MMKQRAFFCHGPLLVLAASEPLLASRTIFLSAKFIADIEVIF